MLGLKVKFTLSKIIVAYRTIHEILEILMLILLLFDDLSLTLDLLIIRNQPFYVIVGPKPPVFQSLH